MSEHHLRGKRRLGAVPLLAALLLATVPVAAAPGADKPANADPSAQPSELMPRAVKSLLLDVASSSSGYFVVGERGHILHSTDGQSWEQAEVPTRSTLTTVAAIGDQVWAAGHDGVIVHSADGGKTWVAQRRDPFDASIDASQRAPSQGAPILDILFTDASHGIAVGAYSLMLVTSDGGATWTLKEAVPPGAAAAAPAAPMEGDVFSAADLELDEETNPHLNAIVDAGAGRMVIVGERGTLLRSEDGGATWNHANFPYKGSMFGVISLGGDRLVAYGLRGNAFESANLGATWSKLPTQGSTSWMGGTALPNGGLALVGANGAILSRPALDAPLSTRAFRNPNGETPMLAAILPDGKGNFLLVGDKGVDLTPAQ